MKFHVLTLFPEIVESYFTASIMAKAVERKLVDYSLVNIRDFAFDKHRTCDDLTYGGGAGMLLMPEPVSLALDSVDARHKRVIYLTPSGKLFTQALAKEFSEERELVLLCGRYEGLDQRVIDEYVTDEVSIGDYVMSSGEIASLVVIDCVYRLLDGVISEESLVEESFSDGLLEYPQYTRPAVFRDRAVPDVLLSGHHEHIRLWRLKKRLEKTLKNRPDLIESKRNSSTWTSELEKLLKEILDGN
ncbi:MAG: tRNA (guanosine(37)-N1)-methyltransferase TrmD [Treponemataceae bacterium]